MAKRDTILKLVDEPIINKIFFIRGEKVMLDRDLAELYGVETRALNQAVKRNMDRFPKEFMFQLTDKEVQTLVSQNVIPSKSYLGGSNQLSRNKIDFSIFARATEPTNRRKKENWI